MIRSVALVVAAAMLASCSAAGERSAGPTSTSSSSSSTSTTVPPPGPAELADPSVQWQDCEGGWECGTLRVPVDYDDPAGDSIDLAVTIHRAQDPDRRIGALLMNPGGPGASGIRLARAFPRDGDLGDRFDIVGFDPRGVAGSVALSCDSHLQAMFDADPTIDSEQDQTLILETSQDFVDECEQNHRDLLAHVGTSNVARDMDQIRRALGDDQISFLGYSYGTSLGQEYARLFPSRVRAMVLDGVVDHEPDGIETARQQAAGFDTAFEDYLSSCAGDDCGLGRDARDVVDDVIAASERAPIPSPSADRPATPGVVALALARGLYARILWPSLTAALRDADQGDGSGLVELADDYLGGDGQGGYDGGMEAYFAVSCLDETWPSDPQDIFDAAVIAEEESPRFGGAVVVDYVRCSLWPVSGEPLAPVPADTQGLPPILVISTTNDPATPYENGVRVAEQIPGAVLLTHEGSGHTVVGTGNPCIDEHFTRYLLDLTLPADGAVCG